MPAIINRHSIAEAWAERTQPKVGWQVDSLLRARGTPQLEQLKVARQYDRLGAAGDLQLAENAVGVGLDRADGDHQCPHNFGIELAAGDQAQHFELTCAERLHENV